MEWKNDCDGDKVIDSDSIIRAWGVAYPDGDYAAKIIIGEDEIIAEIGDYNYLNHQNQSQSEAMAIVERWLKDKIEIVKKLVKETLNKEDKE